MQRVLEYQQLIAKKIEELHLPKEPANLYDPLKYFLKLGGKRTRPTLTLLGCELFGKPGTEAINAAIAVELFHNFTLIHDDIMDEAPLRRGQKTVHSKWDLNIGILSGDVLFVEAYKFLSKHDSAVLPDLLDVFSKTAVEVCEGQQLDMDFENRTDVSIEEYINMIRLKTSVLLGAALKMGGIIGQAKEEDLTHLYNFGVNVGIAFQLKDDLLDLYADPDKFGKQVGGDIIANKKTFLLLKAQELATGINAEILKNTLKETDNKVKVAKSKEFFSSLSIDQLTKDKMDEYYLKAKEHLKAIDVDDKAKENLLQLGEYLMNREE